MIKNYTVSVIVPCYSYGHLLVETLESVVNQSVKAHEIIVVSDGAIDDSVKIAKDFKENNSESNIIILEKENGGLASARNFGIKIATGSHITSVDSDDILRPDAVKEHLKLAGERNIVTLGLMAFGTQNYTARPRVATVEILLKTNCIYSNSLFPRQAWFDIGGFDESDIMRHGWEDREFFLRCLGAGYTSVVGDIIALLWRRHGSNMSEATANPHAELLQEYIYEKNKHLITGQ